MASGMTASRSTESLSTSDLAELADVSRQSIRDNCAYFERLDVMGLLDIDDGKEGCADRWSASFPGAGRDDLDTDDVAVHILGSPPWGAEAWGLGEAVQEILLRLTDDMGQSLGIAFAGEAAQSAFTGPPDERSLQPLVSQYEELRPLVGLVAGCLETTLPTESDEAVVRYGQAPAAALQQQTVGDAATVAE